MDRFRTVVLGGFIAGSLLILAGPLKTNSKLPIKPPQSIALNLPIQSPHFLWAFIVSNLLDV